MPEEMKIECVEISMTACEKYTTNYEVFNKKQNKKTQEPGAHFIMR